MTKSKKITSALFGVAFAFLAGGATCAAIVPTIGGEQSAKVSASAITLTDSDSNGYYDITSASDLSTIATQISLTGDSDWKSGKYELKANIDLGELGKLWTPIGTKTNPFAGEFNGNGYVVDGILSAYSSSVDQYRGLFGYVEGGKIFNLVLGDFAYSYDSSSVTSGRLAGYVGGNSLLADIYDLSYINVGTSRTLKTIGTLDSAAKIYGGDTFVDKRSGKNYTPGKTAGYSPSSTVQFDVASGTTSTLAGRSVYVFGTSKGKVFDSNDLTAKTEITPYRVLINNDGSSALTAPNYRPDFPTQYNVEKDGTTYVEATTLGDRLIGWSSNGGTKVYKGATGIKEWMQAASTSTRGYVEAVWHKVTYKFAITGCDTDPLNINVPFASSWDTIYKFSNAQVTTQIIKSGYDLLRLYDAQGDYVTVTPNYKTEEEGLDKNFTVSYKQNDFGAYVTNFEIPATSKSDTTITVNLSTEWQGAPLNANIAFTAGEDSKIDMSVITNPTIAYDQDEHVQGTYATLTLKPTGVDGQWTFRPVADTKINFGFSLKAGYEILGQPTLSGGNGAVVLSHTQNNYTAAISGLKSGTTPTITFTIVRTEINLAIVAENFDTVEFTSRDQTYTTDFAHENNDWTFKSRIGESFTIKITPKSGWKASGYQLVGFNDNQLVTTTIQPTLAGDGSMTLQVTLGDDFAAENKIVINSERSNYTITLQYFAEEYSAPEKPSVVIQPLTDDGAASGQSFSSAGATTWDKQIPIAGQTKITTTGNAYYLDGTLSLVPEVPAGVTLEGENGVYTLKLNTALIQGDLVVTLKVTYPTKYYNLTVDAKWVESDGEQVDLTSADILGLNGEKVDSSTVVTVSAKNETATQENATQFKYGDTIKISYNILDPVKDYYKFVGWYTANGKRVSTVNGDLTQTGAAENISIIVGIRGSDKQISVKPGNQIYRYDGADTTHEADENIVSVSAESISFTYSKPDQGTLSFEVQSGYNFEGLLFYNPSAETTVYQQLQNHTAFILKLKNGNAVNGYNSLQCDEEGFAITALFDSAHSEYVLIPYVTQKTAKVVISSNNLAPEKHLDESYTYYYGGEGFDLGLFITENYFAKTGHTASGWNVSLDTSVTSKSDSDLQATNNKLDMSSIVGILNFVGHDDKTITIERTFTANSYNVYVEIQTDDVIIDDAGWTMDSATKYHKSVVYGQEIGRLPIAKRVGHTFDGWQVAGGKDYNEHTYLDAEGLTLVPKFTVAQRTFVISSNVSYIDSQTISWTYGTTLDQFATANGALSMKAWLESKFARPGFVPEAVHYVKNRSEYVGKIEFASTKYEKGEIFGEDLFADESTSITLYVSYSFNQNDFSMSMSAVELTAPGYKGSLIDSTHNFNTTITYNSNAHKVEESSLVVDQNLKISSAKWSYKKDQEGSYSELGTERQGTAFGPVIKHVSESGYYQVVYTIADSALQVDVAELRTNPLTLTADALVTVKPTDVKVNYGGTGETMLGGYQKIMKITKPIMKELCEEQAILDMMDLIINAEKLDESTLESMNQALSQKAEELKQKYGDSEKWGGIQWVLPVVAFKFAQPDFAAYLKAQGYTKLADLSVEQAKAWLKNPQTFIDPQYSDIMEERGEYYLLITMMFMKEYDGHSDVTNYTTNNGEVGNGKYDGESWMWLELSSGNMVLHYIADSKTITLVDESGNASPDAGSAKYLKMELNPNTSDEGFVFEATDYNGITTEGGKYYYTADHVGTENGYVYKFYVYAPLTTIEMEQTTGVVQSNSKPYEFTLQTPISHPQFSKADVTFATTQGTEGAYNMLDGTISISSYKLYLESDESKYYVVSKQEDGSYAITSVQGDGLSTEDDINLSNICFYIDGTFNIIPRSDVNTFTFSPRLLSATGEHKLASSNQDIGANYNVSITQVFAKEETFGDEESEVLGSESWNYSKGSLAGQFAFQIVGNNSNSVTLYATKDISSVQIKIATADGKYVGTVEYKSEENYFENILKSANGNFNLQNDNIQLSSLVTEDGEVKLGQSKELNVVYTTASCVNVSSQTDKGLDAGFFTQEYYVSFTDTDFSLAELTSSVPKAFTLTNWTSAQGATVAENKLTMPEQRAAVINLVAHFALTKPTATLDDQTPSVDSNINGKFSLSNFESEVQISPDGKAQNVTYTYKWFKQDGTEITDGQILKGENGTYKVQVIAKHASYNDSEASELDEFTITFTKFSIKIELSEGGTQTYNYENFNGKIKFNVTETQHSTSESTSTASKTLAELITTYGTSGSDILDIKIYFKLQGDFGAEGVEGQVVSEIKNAGYYKIVIALKDDTRISNAVTLEYTAAKITVNKAKRTITTDDNVKFEKQFGSADPVLSKQLTGVNGEQITVTFTREKGDHSEDVGTYDLQNPTTTGENYELSIEPAEENNWFEIKANEGKGLSAEIEGSFESFEYDGEQDVKFTVEFAESSLDEPAYFNLKVEIGANGTKQTKTFKLTNFINTQSGDGMGQEVQVISALLDHLTFKFDKGEGKVKDAGTYTIQAIAEAKFGYGSFTFSTPAPVLTITQKKLNVSEISKEYDGKQDFAFTVSGSENGTMSANVTGLVDSEKVSLTGQFEKAWDDGKSTTSITLSLTADEVSKNYTLGEGPFTGTIKKSSQAPTQIDLSKKTFVYGEVAQDLEAIKKVVTAKFGEFDALEGATITVTIDVSTEAKYSTSHHLAAGTYKINVAFTSDRLADKTESIENVQISKSTALTATVNGELTKEYDGNKTLPAGTTVSLTGNKVGNDDIQISAEYQDAGPGQSVGIKFTITGTDAENYDVQGTEGITGKINSAGISVTAHFNPKGDEGGANVQVDGVKGADFVDGKSAEITTDDSGPTSTAWNFEIAWPTEDAATVMQQINAKTPTKQGYEFKGWAYLNEANLTDISQENIIEVLGDSFAARTLNLYAKWEIGTVKLTAKFDAQNFAEGAAKQGEAEGSSTGLKKTDKKYNEQTIEFTYTYYSTITITSKPNKGWVALQQQYVFDHLDQDKDFDVKFREALITFEVKIDYSELYLKAATEPSFSNNDGWSSADGDKFTLTRSSAVEYSSLASTLASTILPTITITGYELQANAWRAANDKSITFDGSKDLQALVNEVAEKNGASLTQDYKVTLVPSFEAKESSIAFNTEGGTPDPEKITGKYGQAIGQELPSNVTKQGYVFKEWQYQGVKFEDTEFKHEGEITLDAVWEAGVFELTISTEHLESFTVYEQTDADREEVVSAQDGKYKLTYTKKYSIVATPSSGYELKQNSWNTGTKIESSRFITSYTKLEITKMWGDETITIKAEAISQTITVKGEHIESISVTVNASGCSPSGGNGTWTFNANTGDTVQIVVTMQNGYEIVDVPNVSAGSVNSASAPTYVLTGFTSSVEITFTTQGKLISATFNHPKGVSGIEADGTRTSSSSQTVVNARVGETISITINLLEGYDITDVAVSVGSATSTFNKEHISTQVEFSAFTDNFTVTISTDEKSYNMNAKLFVLDYEDKPVTDGRENQFSVTDTATAKYLSTYHFVATNKGEKGFVFVGWFYGELSLDESGVLDYANKDKASTSEDYAYTVALPRDATFTAVYKYAEINLRVSKTGKGTISVSKNGQFVEGGQNVSSYSANYVYGDELTLIATAEEGYVFAGWTRHGHSIEGGETLQITISDLEEAEEYIEYVAKFTAEQFEFNITAAIKVDGLVTAQPNLSGDFGSIEWGTYVEGMFTADPSGSSNPIKAVTDGEVYLKVTPSAKFKFVENSFESRSDVSVAITPIATSSDQKIFRISGLKSTEKDLYNIWAIFEAKVTKYNIKFAEDGAQVDAGQLAITNGDGLNISGNGTQTVVASVVAGSSFQIVASVRFGFKIGETKVSANGVSIREDSYIVAGDEKDEQNIAQDGWASVYIFTISDNSESPYEGTRDIVVNVVSETYTVKFVADGEVVDTKTTKITNELGAFNGVQIKEKQDYQFMGYYTMVEGRGRKYVDASGNQVVGWKENGHHKSGNTYVQDAFYIVDGDEAYFELYAAYVIDKTTISVEAIPPALKDSQDGKFEVRKVITNINDANSWTIESDKFSAEVLHNATVNVAAPEYEGYKFAQWKISRYRDGSAAPDVITSTESVIYALEHDGFRRVVLEATYLAHIEVSASEGGRVYFTYNNGDEDVEVENGEDLQNTQITLHAIPSPGYSFAGWFVVNADESLTQIEGAAKDYEVPGTVLEAKHYHAIFVGDAVDVKIGDYNTEHGHITQITINDSVEPVDLSTGLFAAKIGDELHIMVQTDQNFEVIFENQKISPELGNNNAFRYKIAYEDVDQDSHQVLINLAIEQLVCRAEINVSLSNAHDASELALAGIVRYERSDNTMQEVGSSAQFEARVGEVLVVEVIPRTNYKLKDIVFNGESVLAQLQENKIALILRTGTNSLQITFERDMWIENVVDGYALKGEGTDGNAFEINTVQDLAYVSFMVNEQNDTMMAGAHYVLKSDINLAGKFWSPIGTEENPFDGVFDFGSYHITGATLVMGFDGEVHYNSVFGVLGPRARILETNEDLIIALIIIGVILFLIIIALIIFFVWRRERKKKLEELQNS